MMIEEPEDLGVHQPMGESSKGRTAGLQPANEGSSPSSLHHSQVVAAIRFLGHRLASHDYAWDNGKNVERLAPILSALIYYEQWIAHYRGDRG